MPEGTLKSEEVANLDPYKRRRKTVVSEAEDLLGEAEPVSEEPLGDVPLEPTVGIPMIPPKINPYPSKNSYQHVSPKEIDFPENFIKENINISDIVREKFKKINKED